MPESLPFNHPEHNPKPEGAGHEEAHKLLDAVFCRIRNHLEQTLIIYGAGPDRPIEELLLRVPNSPNNNVSITLLVQNNDGKNFAHIFMHNISDNEVHRYTISEVFNEKEVKPEMQVWLSFFCEHANGEFVPMHYSRSYKSLQPGPETTYGNERRYMPEARFIRDLAEELSKDEPFALKF